MCIFDPFSIYAGVSTSVAFLGATKYVYNIYKCSIIECCADEFDNLNFNKLTRILKEKLYGQHLINNRLVMLIESHFTAENPSRALSISFHGSTGTGKNYVAELIAESFYEKGMQSKYVHLISSTYEYTNRNRLEEYKDNLRSMVIREVSRCPRSIFIFDELDRMPEGLLDTLTPFLDHYKSIGNVDYRKATFLFLSNTASSQIAMHTYDQWTKHGNRNGISYMEMERLISLHAFNQEGAFANSALIRRHLISAYLPFLPLQRKHAIMCVKDAFEIILKKRKLRSEKLKILFKDIHVTDSMAETITSELVFFNSKEEDDPKYGIFVVSGCKRIAEKVAAHIYRNDL